MKKMAFLFPWGMWALASGFFAYQFILRLFPGLILDDIIHKFQIDATSFGILSAAYYCGYAGMQIPIALLLDRYGPRIVISICAAICALSIFTFAYTDHWPLMLVSRFLIGAASAVGFLGTSKIISLWFGRDQYARMVGFSFSFGLLGALYGGKPVSLLISEVGWQSAAFLIFLLGIGFAVTIFLFLRSPRTHQEKGTALEESSTASFADIKKIITRKRLLILAAANLLMSGTLEGFADAWGVTYLMKAYDFTKGDSALVVSFIFMGMIVGGPFLAYVSDRWKAHYEITALSGIALALCIGGLLAFHGMTPHLVQKAIFFVAGIFCCYQVLIFAIGARLVPIFLMGITTAFLNCVNMLGGSFFHVLIGGLLDCFWDGRMDEGARFYCDITYSKALWIIPVASLIGGFLVIFLKTYDKRVDLKAKKAAYTG